MARGIQLPPYQGIVQIRNAKEEQVKKVYQIIEKEGGNVVKEIALRNGLDIYVDKAKVVLAAGKKINSQFRGLLKTSRRQKTMDVDKRKQIYRVTVAFHFAAFEIGKKYSIRGVECRIISIGQKVTVQNIKSGKKMSISFEEVQTEVLRSA